MSTLVTELKEPAGLRRTAIRGGTLFLACRLATQLFVWGVTLAVARLLRPYDYGLMTTGMIFVGLGDLLAEAGVGKALVQKEQLTRADLAEGFSISLLLSAGLYGLLFALAGPASVFLETPAFASFLRVLALIVLLVPFRSIPLAVLERNLHLGSQSAVHFASAVAQAVLVLILAIAGFEYWSLAAGVLSARLLECGAYGWVTGWRPRLVRPSQAARSLLGFGVHVSLATLLWFVYSNADYAVISKLAGPIALGYYAFAFQLISLPVQKLTSNVNQVAYPVFCRLRGDRERVRDWYLRLTVLLGLFGMPVLIGMALVADDGFAIVLGDKWHNAVLPFQLLSAVGTLMILSASLPPLFNALGRPDINLKYTACCTLLLPAGFVALGIPFGLVGICLAWLVLYPAIVGGLVWRTRGLTGIGVRDALAAQRPVLGAVLVMTIGVLAARWLFRDCPIVPVRLSACIGIGTLAYVSFVMVFARTALADLRIVLRELRGHSNR